MKREQMKQKVTGLRVAAALAILACAFAASPAAAQSQMVRRGVLTCATSASLGLVVASRQRLRCQFKSDNGWVQNYVGRIGRVGLDVGITAGGILVWAVLTNGADVQSGALSGVFAGASGSVSVGVGAGANILVGGSRRAVSLQPLSVEGQLGINLALGVARMTLTPTR